MEPDPVYTVEKEALALRNAALNCILKQCRAALAANKEITALIREHRLPLTPPPDRQLLELIVLAAALKHAKQPAPGAPEK